MRTINIMKTKISFVTLVMAMSFSFLSCEKDSVDDEKPVISNLEIGHDGFFQAGAELHVEFEVSDNEGLDYYQITIHHEGEHKSTVTEWELDEKFDEINGLKNYTVHNHDIEVPADAELGDYHVHLMVVDLAGNVADEELELELVLEDIGME